MWLHSVNQLANVVHDELASSKAGTRSSRESDPGTCATWLAL